MKRGIIVLFVIALVGFAIYNNISGKEGADPTQDPVSVEPGEDQSGDASSANEELPEEGFRAPDFTLKGLDGQTYTLSKVNKPVVVNFWASWCPPCKAEAPELVKLYDKYGDHVEIYAVNMMTQDNVKDAQGFVNEYGFQFPVPVDEEGVVAGAYRIQAIPTSFFIDSDGIIVKKVIGLVTPEELDNLFKQLAEDK